MNAYGSKQHATLMYLKPVTNNVCFFSPLGKINFTGDRSKYHRSKYVVTLFCYHKIQSQIQYTPHPFTTQNVYSQTCVK